MPITRSPATLEAKVHVNPPVENIPPESMSRPNALASKSSAETTPSKSALDDSVSWQAAKMDADSSILELPRCGPHIGIELVDHKSLNSVSCCALLMQPSYILRNHGEGQYMVGIYHIDHHYPSYSNNGGCCISKRQ
mmetsp:Transcript_8916/g.54823  ORF Transcript_8916/g.54823 Transcript_8916/m.54823 type:complete len:137 (-) Transcript_8916:753-1163(-)|eukprot:CAMPEP_0113926602 /NCGR_PEP_ID=MMETSP1159-20121227/3844_1 /TAXON_ID=88271 /ORGANISM="Picocystis salinarum" /LENGTH=136 /DNA_ID=CAMNT_0000927009 /DNA_START=451 /DNA_END=861 /DNA_ORIENTATION=- /assembly_acc=CAM_ASM_000767